MTPRSSPCWSRACARWLSVDLGRLGRRQRDRPLRGPLERGGAGGGHRANLAEPGAADVRSCGGGVERQFALEPTYEAVAGFYRDALAGAAGLPGVESG